MKRKFFVLLLIFFFLGLISFFLIKPVQIDGNSMVPNYFGGQRYLTEKFSYLVGEPQRGDVILYRYPEDEDYILVHRVIGLPGETIKISQSAVFINDKKLKEPYISGRTYVLTEKEPPELRGIKLAEDNYYLMGDNREKTDLDSRAFGPISKEFIIGKLWMPY
jgi:signal peptidase I